MTTWLWHLIDRYERGLTMDFKEAGDDPKQPPGPPKFSFGPPKQPGAWVWPVLWITLVIALGVAVVLLGAR